MFDMPVNRTVKKTGTSSLAITPGRLAKELQPLDIGVNRSFKGNLQAYCERVE